MTRIGLAVTPDAAHKLYSCNTTQTVRPVERADALFCQQVIEGMAALPVRQIDCRYAPCSVCRRMQPTFG